MSDAQALVPTQEMSPAHTVNTGPAYERLTIADIGLVLSLHHDGKSQIEIAERLGKTQSAISRCLKKLGASSVDVAKRIAEARAYRAVTRLTRIAEKSQDQDAAIKASKSVLEVAGLTGQRVSGVNVGVQVVVNQPGAGGIDASSITVTTEPQKDANGR